MRRFSLSEGARVVVDGDPLRLVAQTEEGGWQLIDERTRCLSFKRTSELLALYSAGRLTFVEDVADIPADRPRPRLISDHSQAAQARIDLRSKVLREVDLRTRGVRLTSKVEVGGKPTMVLAIVLREISHDLGRKRAIGVTTYYRWRALELARGDPADLAGKFTARGGVRLDPAVRKIVLTVFADGLSLAKERQGRGQPPLLTMRAMTVVIRKAIAAENARRASLGPGVPSLTMPARSTLYEIWNEFPAYDRAVAKFGHTKARSMFRGMRGFDRADACLDHVEYDETQLPFFFFDEVHGVPLGRTWLAWYIDVYSQIPVGFYLGFEPPSDLTIASALRHACSPKAYVADEYPDMVNEYEAAGVPRAVTFDNGLSQWGDSIEQTAADLGGMEIRFATARTPWFKPVVEGMFDVLNDVLLQELPGFVLAPKVDRHDYDPTKQGCIGLRHFLWIFHLWLIDVYCQTPRGARKLTPAQRWREGTRIWAPDFIARAKDLEVLFGTVRTATLDHRGVVYETLRYYSDELHDFRLRDGHHRQVRVKINPADLAAVYVWDAKNQAWIKAVATDLSYAKGLSLHRHALNRRHASEQFGSTELEALLAAEQHLRDTIAQALPMALSIRANANIARALGVGTQHIFGNLDVDGHLGPLSGPFAGQTLNPLRDAPRLPDPEPTSRQPLIIPRFAADRSLRRSR